jgi:hypothetical protein
LNRLALAICLVHVVAVLSYRFDGSVVWVRLARVDGKNDHGECEPFHDLLDEVFRLC